MKVTVHSGGKIVEYQCEKGKNLLSLLQQHGYRIAAGCGGRGSCGKCRVKVLGGSFQNEEGGYVLSCRAIVEEDCAIEVFEAAGGGLTYAQSAPFETDKKDGFGIALDIGTTTLAFALVDLKTGQTLETRGELNSQCTFGADVVSRIVSANVGNGPAMQKCILDQIRQTCLTFAARRSNFEIERLAVCGNTTMLHLFAGKSVEGIGKYPFQAEFLETLRLRGKDLGLPVQEVLLLPSVAAYLGADVVAGGVSCALENGCNLLVDIGTNGEMLLHANGKYFSTSTAAGPCFEGANIECGMGGLEGAVNTVNRKDGKIEFTTVGGKAPVGICGAGLVDAVALLLRDGTIDETGAFQSEKERFYVAPDVYVSQKDVRNYQLAKSAILSGIRILLNRAGVGYDDLNNLYIAGGLGFYLNRENAVATGLLPAELQHKIRVIGNSALEGTKMALCGQRYLEQAQKLARATEYIDLSADEDFMEEYIANMGFDQ